MTSLFIISDDFTGALDTGVQFAELGAVTRVITDAAADFGSVANGADVLVLDAETRHLPAEKAYQVVYRAVRRAVDLKIPYIFKKTDSALRGNIGAELTAVLDATGKKILPFLPALPSMGRCTRGGIHYINDLPVAESVFGKDPFEPVVESDISRMIAMQSPVKVSVLDPRVLPEVDGVAVYNAASSEELAETAAILLQAGQLKIMAGCAGLGFVLPELLKLKKHDKQPAEKIGNRLLVLCGSVNPITVAQLNYAESKGFAHIRLTPEEKLENGFFQKTAGLQRIADWKQLLKTNSRVIIDVNDLGGKNEATHKYALSHGLSVEDLRVKISETLGEIMGALFNDENVGTILVSGGDTLLQCMNRIGAVMLEPVGQIYPGVVLARTNLNGVVRHVIAKSGGFGQETLLVDMTERNQ